MAKAIELTPGMTIDWYGALLPVVSVEQVLAGKTSRGKIREQYAVLTTLAHNGTRYLHVSNAMDITVVSNAAEVK